MVAALHTRYVFVDVERSMEHLPLDVSPVSETVRARTAG